MANEERVFCYCERVANGQESSTGKEISKYVASVVIYLFIYSGKEALAVFRVQTDFGC